MLKSTGKLRIYVKGEIGSIMDIPERSLHYIRNVMRSKVGDRLCLFNEKYDCIAEIRQILKRRCEVEIIEKKRAGNLAVSNLTLLFAPFKNPGASFVVQKAVELGVSRIIPVITDYTVVRSLNFAKLKLSMIEALEQCMRYKLPVLEEEVHFERVLGTIDKNSKLLFGEMSNTPICIKNLPRIDFTKENYVFIGPEGGFSMKENRILFSLKNGMPISLGEGVLRSETAIISMISLYNIMSFRNHETLNPLSV